MNGRRLISAVCLLLSALALPAQTNIVKVDLGDTLTASITNRKFTITPLNAPFSLGGRVIVADKITRTTDTNGIHYLTNMVASDYQVDVLAPPANSTFWITVRNSGTNIQEVGRIRVPTTTRGVSELGYTRAQTDALIAGVEGAINPNAVTNNQPVVSFGVVGAGTQLIIGEGTTNEVTISAVDGGAAAEGAFTFDEIIANAITFGGVRRTTWPEGGGGGTNGVTGIYNTEIIPLISTNDVVITGTNRLVLGTVQSITGWTITGHTNVYTPGNIPPLPDYRVEISTNGGADWEPFDAALTNEVMVSFYDVNGGNGGFAESITVYGYTNWFAAGTTIDAAGQFWRVDSPTESRDIANKDYTDTTAASAASAAAANWAAHPASTRPRLDGFGMEFSAKWLSWITPGTNESSLHLGPYGTSLLELTSNDVLTTNTSGQLLISQAYLSGTNIVLVVNATNVVAPIIPQLNTNNAATNGWYDIESYTSTYPNQTNGVYRLTFAAPTWTNTTLYRVRSEVADTNAYSTVRRVTVHGDLSVSGALTVENGMTVSNSTLRVTDGAGDTAFEVNAGGDAYFLGQILSDGFIGSALGLTGPGLGITSLNATNLVGTIPAANLNGAVSTGMVLTNATLAGLTTNQGAMWFDTRIGAIGGSTDIRPAYVLSSSLYGTWWASSAANAPTWTSTQSTNMLGRAGNGAGTMTLLARESYLSGTVTATNGVRVGLTNILTPATTFTTGASATGGRLRVASAATSFTLTNSIITSNALVQVWVSENDTTAAVRNVVPGTGIATVNLTAPTADCNFSYLIFAAP